MLVSGVPVMVGGEAVAAALTVMPKGVRDAVAFPSLALITMLL